MVLDIDHLAHATAGDRALQAELLRLFGEQLVATSTRHDDADLRGNLHRLKGASHAIGAKALAVALAEAEAALLPDAPPAARSTALTRLEVAIDQAKAAVDGRLAALRQAVSPS